MRKMIPVLVLAGAFSSLALADDWTGKLLDASCYDRQLQQKTAQDKAVEQCAPTANTTTYALETSGKVFKLDATGNTRAMTALKNRADRAQPGKAPQANAPVMAKISGSESSGTIKLDNIELQ